MKAVTVCQPWAEAIVRGPKRVENRTWYTSHRGPLVIHAGKSREWLTPAACTEVSLLWPGFEVERCDFGVLLGVVDVVDVLRVGDLGIKGRAGRPGVAGWSCGPWCWILERPRAFARPVPWRGAQQLFEVPDDVVTRALSGSAEPSASTPGTQQGLFPRGSEYR